MQPTRLINRHTTAVLPQPDSQAVIIRTFVHERHDLHLGLEIFPEDYVCY